MCFWHSVEQRKLSAKINRRPPMASPTHVILPGSKRPKDPLAKRIGPVDPKEKIDITLGLVGPKLPDAGDYIGKTLTPEELAEKFGATKAMRTKLQKR
jgi:hypothetical protein